MGNWTNRDIGCARARHGIVAAGLFAMMAGFAGSAVAQSDYEGTTVRFLTARNVHQTALGDKLAQIAEEWGIDFDVRYVTTDQLQKKVVVDYVGGAETWDLVYTGGVQRMYEWADGGIIQEMTPLIESVGDPAVLNFDDFTQSAQNAVTTQDDKILGLAVATSDQALAYRADLFEHPDEQAAFEERYGYALAAPQTYKQFKDVAEFFTREAGETLAGETLENDFYGTSFSNKRGTYIWHDGVSNPGPALVHALRHDAGGELTHCELNHRQQASSFAVPAVARSSNALRLSSTAEARFSHAGRRPRYRTFK
jgi:multiple sugar transport system substrate-binding protein